MLIQDMIDSNNNNNNNNSNNKKISIDNYCELIRNTTTKFLVTSYLTSIFAIIIWHIVESSIKSKVFTFNEITFTLETAIIIFFGVIYTCGYIFNAYKLDAKIPDDDEDENDDTSKIQLKKNKDSSNAKIQSKEDKDGEMHAYSLHVCLGVLMAYYLKYVHGDKLTLISSILINIFILILTMLLLQGYTNMLKTNKIKKNNIQSFDAKTCLWGLLGINVYIPIMGYIPAFIIVFLPIDVKMGTLFIFILYKGYIDYHTEKVINDIQNQKLYYIKHSINYSVALHTLFHRLLFIIITLFL